MHINSHFAVGVIIASIFNYFFHFNFMEFSIIVLFSFICDFDVFLSKFAMDNNHRMLITHSIIPSLIILLLGFIFNWIVLILSGISYSVHILIDTLDWGTNFFYFPKRQVGLKFLISKEEFENLSDYLSKYSNPAFFFSKKYYKNKIFLSVEVCLFLLMITFIIIFAFEFILITLLYIPFVYFHLSRHLHLKKMEIS